MLPAEVAEPFAAAYRRVAPDSPFGNLGARRPLDMYQAMYAKVADRIRESGQFREPEQWRFDWEQSYTRDQWLSLLPTTGGLTRLRPDQLADILDEVGTAIDALDGAITMPYTTLATSAARVSRRFLSSSKSPSPPAAPPAPADAAEGVAITSSFDSPALAPPSCASWALMAASSM